MESFKGQKYVYKYDIPKKRLIERIEKKIDGYKMAGDKKANFLEQQIEKLQSGLNVPKEIKDEYGMIHDMFAEYKKECKQASGDIKQQIRNLLWSEKPKKFVEACESIGSALSQIKEEKEKTLKPYACFNQGKRQTPAISSIISRISAGFDPKISELEGALTEANIVINKEINTRMQNCYDNQPLFKRQIPIAKYKMEWEKYINIEYRTPNPDIRKLTESAYKNLWQDYLKQKEE